MNNMLFHITDPKDFSHCIMAVRKTLWPFDMNYADCFSFPSDIKNSEETAKQAYTGMETAIARYLEKGYCSTDGIGYEIPFCDWWHKFFAIRKWPLLPAVDPAGYLLDIKNSANEGNYNHIVNVTAAAAHLIHHFRSNGRCLSAMCAYEPSPDKRTLLLMTAAYYHDLGKVIVNRRHAVEGMSFFAEHKASVRNMFEKIFMSHGFEWTSRDCAFISALIGNHDVFGTISTGENGYFSLISAARIFALLENGGVNAAKRDMFDLWLLNIADIIVSIENKWGDHRKFTEKPPGESESVIQDFFEGKQGKDLLTDLTVALRIAENACESRALEDYVYQLSESAAAARFTRLIWHTLRFAVKDGVDGIENKYPNLSRELHQILSDEHQIRVMVETVMTEKTGVSWAERFGNLGQFDYALGFFRNIAKRATYWIGKELSGEKNVRTGWLYHQKPDGRTHTYDTDFLDRYMAETIIDNYMVFMSDIFCDIARMTEGMGHWHIEFEDALNRLTDSKADKLLYMDGPHRAGHTRSLLMKELMLYKV